MTWALVLSVGNATWALTFADTNYVLKRYSGVQFHFFQGIIVALVYEVRFVGVLSSMARLYHDIEGLHSLQGKMNSRKHEERSILTSKRTFSSNLRLIFVFGSSGANSVQPDSNLSPSGRTRATEVAIASVRIFESRIRSLGSEDWSFRRNSENTEIARFPNMKSITAWQNQSLKVDVYILKMACKAESQCDTHLLTSLGSLRHHSEVHLSHAYQSYEGIKSQLEKYHGIKTL